MKKILSVLATAGVLVGTAFAANAATLNTPLTVSNMYPSANGTATIAGDCTTANANGSVSFSLVRNGTTINLSPSGNVTATGNGTFNSTVTFPADYAAGPATLVARCANGDVINSNSLTFASPTSTSFTLTGVNPTAGGSFNVSQSCGASSGAGTAQLFLQSNGVSTSLGTYNLNPTGNFNGGVIIPQNYGSGSATLTANCSNGNTFSSPINIGQAAVSNFTLTGSPTVGGVGSVAGSCGTAGTNTNGTINFSLTRNNVSTPITGTNLTTNASGQFNATINYPSGYGTGNAVLTVTCPNGANFTNPISLSAAQDTGGVQMPSGGLQMPSGITDPTAVGGSPEGQAPTNSTTSTGSVLGASNTTPVGGVDAGNPANSTVALNLGVLSVLMLGAGASYYISRKLSK